MSKLAKELENWQQAEKRHAGIFGKAALRTRGYRRLRLAEMQRIQRSHRGKPLSLDDRVRMRMLRAGNRHLERQLYPNRLVRYTRRVLLFTRRSIGSLYRRLKRMAEPVRKTGMQPAGKTGSPQKAVPEMQGTDRKTKIVRMPPPVVTREQARQKQRGRSL